MSISNVLRSNPEFYPLLRIFAVFVLGFNAISAKAEMSPHDILQHFYQTAGGSAWERF
jgi:hypothetical protein